MGPKDGALSAHRRFGGEPLGFVCQGAGHLDVVGAEGAGTTPKCSKSQLMSFFESKRRFICLLHFCLLFGKKAKQHRSLAQVTFGFKKSPEPDDIGLNDSLHNALRESKQRR